MALVAGVDGAQLRRAQFEDFVATYGDRLLHTAYGLCGDWQHAEDLVQLALLKVAARWDAITDNPAGYAYRCLARANIDRWRVLRRHPEVLADPTTLRTMRLRTIFSRDDEQSAVDVHLTVAAALQILPPRQRAIVVLRYLQDLSESDTAHVLGIGVGAVKSGASRALAHLRTVDPSPFQEVDR